MKTCTALCRPLLLVVMLAVSWAAAAPLQDTPSLQDIQSEEQLQAYLENHPSAVDQLYPDLLREASEVLVIVDPDVMVNMLRRQEAAAPQEEEEAQEGTEQEEEDEHDRRKRQATFGFGANRGPYGRDYRASAGYNRNFNRGRSSVGVNAHRNWGASGRSHGFGINFTHRFGR